MKIKNIIIIFMMLILTVIPFINISKAKPDPPHPITIIVSIIDDKNTNPGPSYEALDNYSWMVNNTEYRFSANKVKPNLFNKSYLEYDKSHLLIMDGVPRDVLYCAIFKDFRTNYTNYIEAGGGFINQIYTMVLFIFIPLLKHLMYQSC